MNKAASAAPFLYNVQEGKFVETSIARTTTLPEVGGKIRDQQQMRGCGSHGNVLEAGVQ